MRKKTAFSICLLSMAILLVGCDIKQTDQSSLGDNSPVYGDIEITDEIRGEFFDFAREERWDWLPNFEMGKPPTALEDYMEWIIIREQVWAGFDDIDRDATPKKLSQEYVSAMIKSHFGVEVSMPPAMNQVFNPYDKYHPFTFDGKDFTIQVGGWAIPPYSEITELSLENIEGQDVYTVKVLEYHSADGSLIDIPKETIVMLGADKSAVRAFAETEIKFYLDADGNIVYLSVERNNLPN